MPEPSWVIDLSPGRLAVMPRPRGGEWLDGDVKSLRRAGVTVVVSLLTASEAAELELQAEERICELHGIEYLSFPIQDRQVPAARPEFTALVRSVAERIKGGSNVVIHCRMGIGRSALVAACILGILGQTTESAFELISAARGFPVPDTQAQFDWAVDFVRNCDESAAGEAPRS